MTAITAKPRREKKASWKMTPGKFLLYFFMYLGTQIMILGNQVPSWGGFWTWCFLCLAIFTIIRQVPAWASIIIESAGTEAMANQLSGIGGKALQKASSAAMLIR